MDAKDKRIAELERLLQAALEEIAQLKERIAILEKNSGNSSKPPSSDIVKPPKQQKKKRKRKIGAQKGHKPNFRTPFTDQQIDEIIHLTLDACPKCNGTLVPSNEPPKKHQQVELVEKPFIVKEYHQHQYWCEQCQCYHNDKLPAEVKRAGLFGTRLIALTGYLKGRCHMSYTTMQSFFSDALSIRVSRGFLAKQIHKVSDALEQPYAELLTQLPKEPYVRSDETGGSENGKKRWTWCLNTPCFTLFHIDPSRSSGVLERLLGKAYAGIISCDFFGAYRKFERLSEALLQLCWAHFIREVKYLAEQKDKKVSSYGSRLLKEIRLMFKTIHCRGKLLERNWQRRMEEHREAILKVAWHRLPDNKDAHNLAERLWNWRDEYFRFIELGIDPTNNLAEQSIRRVVIDRKVTQGTRSDWGNRWLERIWSVLATCEQRGKNVMMFLQSCVESLVRGIVPPKILDG